MRKWILFITLFFGYLSAAAPLTHLYIADLWCESQDIEGASRESVLKGAVFPDIHYLAEISSEATHQPHVRYQDLFGVEDDFIRGCLLHSYVDDYRESLVSESHIYTIVSRMTTRYSHALLKFVEDEILYEECSPRFYALLFNTTIDQEREIGFSGEMVDKWNELIFFYLSMRPSTLMRIQAVSGESLFGIPPDVLMEWSLVIPQLAKDIRIQNYLTHLLQDFTRQFNSHN